MTYWKVANHSGGLKECIESEMPISNDTAEDLVAIGVYTFYGYDYRIHANRYLLTNMEQDYGLPTWLHQYIK